MNSLLKAEDVAKLLNIELSTVYLWARMDYIPHIEFGTGKRKQCIRFDQGEIQEWLTARKKPGRTTRIPELKVRT